MASSDPEIKDVFPLPAWMKVKPAKEFEPFAGSPPAPEDSFYIRYPKSDVLFGRPKLDQDVPRVLSEQSKEIRASTTYNIVKEKDWSKHTKPCQDVMHGIAPINTAANSVTAKPKPAGTDDGFKGEGAACGTSIVKVAHQMMSSKGSRGFAVASPGDVDAAEAAEQQYVHNPARRGSKSLPVTPAHSPGASPTSRRRLNGNRYFTSPFEPVEDSANRSWLTMALLGFKKDLTTSTSTLAEEDAFDHISHGSLAESVENLGPCPKRQEIRNIPHEPIPQASIAAKPAPAAYRAKPSELREMNFWSPTSM